MTCAVRSTRSRDTPKWSWKTPLFAWALFGLVLAGLPAVALLLDDVHHLVLHPEAQDDLSALISAMLDALEKSRLKVLSSEEALRRAERDASVGRLAATVAHEVRNPLSAINQAAQLLELVEIVARPGRAGLKALWRPAAMIVGLGLAVFWYAIMVHRPQTRADKSVVARVHRRGNKTRHHLSKLRGQPDRPGSNRLDPNSLPALP